MISPQDGTQYLQALRQVAWHYQQQTNHSAVVSTPAGRTFQSPLTDVPKRAESVHGRTGPEWSATATGYSRGGGIRQIDGYPATTTSPAIRVWRRRHPPLETNVLPDRRTPR